MPVGIPRAAARLVAVHPLVGRRQQVLERRPILGETGRPRADRQRDADAGARLERIGAHRILHFGHPARLVLGAAVPQHDDELVAGEARAQVALADRRRQHRADRAQRPVARIVAVGVVDLLQAIEIEDDDTGADPGLRRERQPGLELPIERAPVGQRGQRIGMGLVLGLLEARRIVDDRRGLFAHPDEDAAVFVGEAARDRMVDDDSADQIPFEDQRTGQQRRQIRAVRVAAVGARREPEREVAPRLRRPLEQRLGAWSVRGSADVAVVVVAQEQGARRERHEAADLVVDQRHRAVDAQVRSEGLRDFVERLFLAMGARNVLQRQPSFVRPRACAGGVGGQQRRHAQPRDQQLHQFRIERLPGVLTEHGDRLFRAAAGPVRAVRLQSAVAVRNRQDARADGNIRAPQPRRIAQAVPAFVMAEHELGDRRAERHVAQYLRADAGMGLDALELLRRERVGFRENVFRDGHVADVVQQGRRAHRLHLLVGEADPFGQRHRVLLDRPDVLRGAAGLGFNRQRERLDRRQLDVHRAERFILLLAEPRHHGVITPEDQVQRHRQQ